MKRLERQIISFLCAALLLLQLGGGACALTDGDQLPEEIPERQEEELQTEDIGQENTDAIDGQPLPEGGGEAQSSDDDPAPEGNNVSQVEEPQTLPAPEGNNVSQVEEPKTLSVPTGNNVSQVEEPKTLSVPTGNNVSQAEEPQTLPAPAENNVSQAEEPQTLSVPAGNRMLLFSAQAPAAQTDTSAGDAGQKGGAANASTLTVAGQSFSSTEDSSGNGWKYDAQDGSLVLVDYNGAGQSISTTGGGITIKAAGLNRLAKLSVDGSVDLIGTGILLVDEIEMPEEGSFNLHANTEIYGDDAGSVAVFLMQEDGSYLLMNGAVNALLDEAYTVPDGVTLVIPDHSTLVMQSLAIAEYTPPEGEKVVTYSTTSMEAAVRKLPDEAYTERDGFVEITGDVEDRSTFPQLTISQSAKLIVQEAAIVMNGIAQQVSQNLVPKLLVMGQLELSGNVTGGITQLKAEGALSGSGSFHDAEVVVYDNQNSITASDSTVILLNQTTTNKLTLSGESTLRYGENAGIGELELASGADVDARGHWATDPFVDPDSLTVGTLSGNGTITWQNGSVSVGAGSSESSPAETYQTGGIITRGTGESAETFVAGPDGLVLIPDSGAELADGSYQFPVLKVLIRGSYEMDGTVKEHVERVGENPLTTYSCAADTDVLLSQLKSSLLLEEGADKWIEIYYLDSSGKREKMVITPEDNPGEDTISPASICLIRSVATIYQRNGTSGGSATQTSTTFTGTGILGGSGAGSVKGGTGTSITIPRTAPENHNSGAGETGKTEETQGEEPAAPGQTARLWVEEREADSPYVLHMEMDGREITDPERPVEVRMDYTLKPGEAGQKLYVVFRLPGGRLKAYAARYDAAEGQLIFETELLGVFVVTAFSFSGEEFSEEFYLALAKTEEVKKLA